MSLKKIFLKTKISYKIYLYYNLYIRHKGFLRRERYSQWGEDQYITQFFKEKEKGIYLDIGCFNPFMYSNTCLLYRRGWKGINIDINPTSIDLFNIARKRDKNICAAISNNNQLAEFYFDHLLSPVNTLSKEFSDLSYKNISRNKYIKKSIQKFTFDKLIEKFNLKIPNIDLLNVDAEAHDFEVLEGFDFDKYKPKIICVELYDSNLELKEKKFKDYLASFKYSLIKKIGPNGIFCYKS